MSRPSEPRPCRDSACDTRVILARRAFTGSWMAFEAADRPPYAQEAMGCFVIVNNEAYRPDELVEDYQVRHELTETKARELVAGFPWHRAHAHEVTPETGSGA